MSLDLFHKSIATWFRQALGAPTDVQNQAWPAVKQHGNTLIAAPTGSGKTLAAFLSSIDDLIRQGLEGTLRQETQIVYVSPLKALSNDIERNLQIPLQGIQKELINKGIHPVEIDVAVRTGDTTASARTAMIKKPPHIIVTTPESLYLLLTSENGRRMLSTVTTLIVDEIHALVGDKRGAHLALSIERLEKITSRELIRIGLSATQKPIEKVAQFLIGNSSTNCKIINTGHKRKLDISIEIPNSPLTSVMANEVWTEIHEKLIRLIETHQTTLIFVNTRRLAERLAHSLSERLGEEIITAHHGSMSKEHRYNAEKRLKSGSLKALIATSSLELGIDIGSVDLVCQIASPRSISAFLQRVGRSGHTVKGTPKGILFPLTRDELVEGVAILDAVRRGELDEIIIPEKPLDILAQQIVAEVANREFGEDELFALVKNAYPYKDLERKEFDDVVQMLSEGFTTRRGRRSAYLHHDMVNQKLRARKGARLTALVSGGAIPDNFEFDVILEPENTFVGTVNEDFAIESLPGDIIQLGNTSWKIRRIENGKVRVEDAHGQPPNIPFWFGEAPGRTPELSQAVSDIRMNISDLLGDLSALKKPDEYGDGPSDDAWKQKALDWLIDEVKVQPAVADQVVMYLAAEKAALGVMPSQQTLVMERFFDEAGDMHLVIHAPFGSRLNKAWGLSLRKRFCRKFNFELQAAANEDTIILSLGSTHSFPLNEVFHYLKPEKVRDILIQAMFDAPVFEVRWRWNASRALAVLRRRAGKKVPPQLQRMQSEDLIALIFPDQLACLENIAGDRDIPDHPLVNQTVHDCLYEAMDIEGLERVLKDIKEGNLSLVAKDLREPSPFAQEILNARPYAFLDNAPAEERRTLAVQSRRWLDPAEAKELGHLDIEAIKNVKAEAWPEAGNADELHDALVLFGFFTKEEGDENGSWEMFFDQLVEQNRATTLVVKGKELWAAVERLPELLKIHSNAGLKPTIPIPERLLEKAKTGKDPLVEIIRGRMEMSGPVTVAELAGSIGLPEQDINQALLALEMEGFVFQGHFTPEAAMLEWCERRLLARIHRYTLQKLRKEIEPVSPAGFMRFLIEWHHLNPEQQPEGLDALQKVIEQLEGFEAQAAAWESDLLPSRIRDYDYLWLDMLCLSGNVIWRRFKTYNGSNGNGKAVSPIKTTPITLVTRNNLDKWEAIGNGIDYDHLSQQAQQVYQILRESGASFFDEIVRKTALLKVQAEEAMSELVALGLLTSDSFTGLRALLIPAKYATRKGSRSMVSTFSLEQAGRWSLLNNQQKEEEKRVGSFTEHYARLLLKRYGVVFRKLAERENLAPFWRDLVRVFRRLEARGEIRGGRFVHGVWGEQFALPEAIPKLRSVRKQDATGELVSISASDPVNLTGIITPGRRISAIYSNRILFRDGQPIAVKEGKAVDFLVDLNKEEQWKIQNALIQRKISPKLKAYLGKGIF